MQIDVFPAYVNQKVGAMIMAIAFYRGAPASVQQLSLSFFSEEVLDEFIREIGAYISPAYPGRNLEVKQQIVEMTLNGSGVRDIARVLRVSTSTVMRELKKALYGFQGST